MDIFEWAAVFLLCGFLIGIILIVIELIIEHDPPIIGALGIITMVIGIISGIVLLCAGSYLKGHPETFKTVASARLKSTAGNLYYIDPKDDSMQTVDVENIDNLYATTDESRIEFTEAKWLCFKLEKVNYYVHVNGADYEQ